MNLSDILRDTLTAVTTESQAYRAAPTVEETGNVITVQEGIARLDGLPTVRAGELLRFPGRVTGMALDVDSDRIGVVVLGASTELAAGMPVRRTRRVVDVPVGDRLLGRVVDALGRPLDDRGQPDAAERRAIEQPAPAIMDRAPVEVPLQTGIKAIDAVVPVGRGQRELILGDRQTGKTAIAVDTILNQRDTDVICVYCAIGQRNSATAKIIRDLRQAEALEYTLVVSAAAEDAPGLQWVAPYAATSMAEFWMRQGRDVLIVYDDLTRHARAYRELSLLLQRPPGREAFPGDIFYIHSRLLERATHLRDEHGGGSLTALPIIETQAQNISAYIPTNLISITDGQIYLSPDLFQQGQLPAIDIGESVSRVGGKTQLPAYRSVAGDLRLSYSQFEELERFSRFGTRLDEETRQTLARGYRVREVLKQPQGEPLPVDHQIAALLAVTDGHLDDVPRDRIGTVEAAVRDGIRDRAADACRRLRNGEKLSDDARGELVDGIETIVAEQTHTAEG